MIPLFRAKQIKAADKFAIENYSIPSILLMENAAESITNEIFKEFQYINKSDCFGIVCGKGNNGGDGFALARKLATENYYVNVLLLISENTLSGDAKINFESLKGIQKDYKNLKIKSFKKYSDLAFIKNSDFIVDAILGTGFSGVLDDTIAKIIVELNKMSGIKIAIDCPTGLNLETGYGELIFNSDLTITLAELKTGLFYESGSHCSGKVVKGSIGIGESYFDKLNVIEYLVEPEDAFEGLPVKRIDINKYSGGKVFVIAGSGKMPGAAIFSMNAAMNSGTGAGFLAFPNSLKILASSQMDSAIVLSYDDEDYEHLRTKNIEELNSKIKWADSILIGPGLGRDLETQKAVIEILTTNRSKKFIIDADAIFALRDKKYKKLNLINSVFTPHHGEFSDLIGIELADLKKNLLVYGRKFVNETQSYLVLKGAPTILFSPNGEVFINSTGNPGLAKFGSGDVLGGIISSFIAQSSEIEDSIISAVYLHGLTADLIFEEESEFGITPNKLINHFPNTIKFLRNSIV